MVGFLLSRKTDFYFWTGILLGIATMANFGTAYTETGYAQGLFPVVSVILFLLSVTLASFYFWSQNRAASKLESGCFGGIATLIMLFNLGYNLLWVIASLLG
ncbi:hypothetical protein [Pontibacter virosus]|uniref:Uncharacterized protein n=1 Tax=Pontibacter virosus TaxID=1765052 RepID=A0A2U1AZN0_9BACT|nr:hypothetical protein [Pontibacter virosus]PVY41791.1 hypothetical protein C8E01_104163 [Pontibacter virosus]